MTTAIQSAQIKALDSQTVVKSELYYSKVRITPSSVSVASGVTTVVFSANSKGVAFSYGLRDDLAAGGWPQGSLQATLAETNLLSRNETNENEEFLIDGAGFLVDPKCDAGIVERILPLVHLSAGFGGNERKFRWGPAIMWQGGGGLFGAGLSAFKGEPNIQDSSMRVPGFISNGSPFTTNYRKIPEGLSWGKKGSRDSTFSVTCELQRSVTLTATARAAGTGITAFAPPTTDGDKTCVEGWIVLFGKQRADRSRNG